MARPEIVRRASYGPMSPAIGERGARTRQQIVDVTLDLFAEQGVHGTLVDDIAKGVGISRATLYQYFESKEQIFLELVEESGAALLRVMKRLQPLGPTPEGFDNLHWWLGEWAWVYERYATMFIQWANVDSPQAPLREMIGRWLEVYTARLSSRLAATPVEGVDPEDLAVALWATVERYNYYRHTRATGLPDELAIDNLAVVVQLMLFPETAPAVFASHVFAADAISLRLTRRVPRRRVPSPRKEWRPEHGRFAGLSAQAMGTVRALLDAGGRLFATTGYHTVNVDQIVVEAGLARGTFYKYFSDKLDLLVTLARECAEEIIEMSARFARLAGPGMAVALRQWLTDFIALHRRHAGVFRVWLEQVPRDDAVQDAGRVAVGAALASIAHVLGRVRREYDLDIGAASLMLLALLERFPDQAIGTKYERAPDRVVETMAAVIERGFLNAATTSPRKR